MMRSWPWTGICVSPARVAADPASGQPRTDPRLARDQEPAGRHAVRRSCWSANTRTASTRLHPRHHPRGRPLQNLVDACSAPTLPQKSRCQRATRSSARAAAGGSRGASGIVVLRDYDPSISGSARDREQLIQATLKRHPQRPAGPRHKGSGMIVLRKPAPAARSHRRRRHKLATRWHRGQRARHPAHHDEKIFYPMSRHAPRARPGRPSPNT